MAHRISNYEKKETLKTRSTKIEQPLVDYKTVTKIFLEPTGR